MIDRTNKDGTCLWCGKKLYGSRRWKGIGETGYRGRGYFHSMECGYRFGMAAAKSGVRLEPWKSPEPAAEVKS